MVTQASRVTRRRKARADLDSLKRSVIAMFYARLLQCDGFESYGLARSVLAYLVVRYAERHSDETVRMAALELFGTQRWFQIVREGRFFSNLKAAREIDLTELDRLLDKFEEAKPCRRTP